MVRLWYSRIEGNRLPTRSHSSIPLYVLTRVTNHVTANPDPLTRSVSEVWRSVKGDFDHVAWQYFCFQDVKFHVGSSKTLNLNT